MNNYLEKFEKMRFAGKLASKTLDMLTEYIKPGISTEYIDKDYYQNYLIAIKAGVKFLAYRCKLNSKEIKIEKKIKIIDEK